jgi:PAS domain S-box-containing protein
MVNRLKTCFKDVCCHTSGRLLALLLLCCLFSITPAAADHAAKSVLIIHSYHPSLNWTAGIMAALQKRLVAHYPDISLHVEYLDTKRNQSPEYFASYVEGVLPQKLSSLNFDLILTSDNDAFNFVRNHRNDLFNGVPVVFCGVNGFTPEMIAGLDEITGVAEVPSFRETVELALQLSPDTRELVFIGETHTETGRKVDNSLHRLTDILPTELKVQFWNDRPLEELGPILGQLKQGQVVLLASVISQRSGHVLTYTESIRYVRDHSAVPIYGVWDFFLGNGIIGGHLTSSQAQGDIAAGFGLRILAGGSAGAIPVATSNSNRYMFDFNELQRFGISLKRLPADSTVINRPTSFYRLGKWQTWSGVTILLLMSLSIFLLIRVVVMRRKSERSLTERARLSAMGAEVGNVLTLGGDLRETLQACTQLLVDQTGAAFGRIWTVSKEDPDRLELQASAGLYTRIDGKHSVKRVGKLKVGIIGSERIPVLTNKVAGDPMFTDQEWIEQEGIVGFAGYPLVVNDRLVGVTAFFSKQPLNVMVQAAIASVADMIAVGIERHRAEEALQSALCEAEEGHDNIDAILRSVVDGLLVTNLEDRVILINQAAEHLLGISFRSACGLPVAKALQGKPFANQLCQLLTGHSDQESLEILFPDHESDKLLTILVHTSTVSRKSGDPGGTVAVIRDVTRERELDQNKNEFIATAAHELRTPLTTIYGYAELLSNEDDLAPFTVEQRREYLNYILSKSEELEHIIDELLDLGRIETGRMIVLDKRRCEMTAMVKEIVKHYEQESTRHQFDVCCPVDCLDMEIDPAKIQRVFDNLLSNAIKYSPLGGIIHIEGKMTDGWLEVSVADEGIGMTSEQVAKAFDKFYRADMTSTTAVGGLGLGLTISKGIIEAHDGDLRIESEPGAGTRAIFRLPLPGQANE